jgi:tetratricopeptide (TPR) repeat protein
MLFATGQAGEATELARALLELGKGDEPWLGQARRVIHLAMIFGPMPAEQAIAEIQAQIDQAGGAKWAESGYRDIGRLRSLQGQFAEARLLFARARATFEDLGQRIALVGIGGDEAELEYRAGNVAESARLMRLAYEAMVATGDRSFGSTIAASLGAMLLDLDDDDEAWRFGTIARDTSATDDVISQAGGRAVQARVLSRRSDLDTAEAVGREAVGIMARTDYLAEHGDVLVHLARVLREAGKPVEALSAARQALDLYTMKGARFFVERAQSLIAQWSA